MKSTPNSSFFKTFLHQCNDLVVITDNDACIVYVNPAFEKHTGYALKRIKGKNISIVKSGVHNNHFYKALWKKLSHGRPHSCVFINKKKNGELYYEHKTITPIKNKKSEIEYYLSTSKDVTTELKLQREVIKQKNFIQSVVQSTDALIIGLDQEYKITLFNSACEKLTGFSFSQVKDKPFLDLVPPGKKSFVSESLVSISKRNRKFLRDEYPILSKNNTEILVSWSNTLMKDEKGNQQAILSTGIDVTKARQNEKKLLKLNLSLDKKIKAKTKKLVDVNKAITEQSEFVKKITRELPALIYLLDLKTGSIRFFNDRINKKISLPEKKDKDIPIGRFFKYIDHRPGSNYESVFLTPTIENTEIPFLIQGKKYWFQNRSIVFEKDENGKTWKILGFISDITNTRFIQSKLVESQKIAKIGTWEWSIKTNKIYWSDEIYSIFEIDKKVFKPSYPRFLRNIHTEDRKSVIEAVNRSLIEKKSYEVTHRLKEKNGIIKFVREKGYTQYDDEGIPIRMIGTVQDITEEKHLRDNLHSAYVTLQNSLNAIVTTDLSGNILFANNAGVKMWGHSDIAAMNNQGSILTNYWFPELRSEIKKIRTLAMETGYCVPENSFSAVRVDGTKIDVKFNLSVIRSGDKKPAALTWCFFDVTEQLKAEKLVKEYDSKMNLLLGNIEEVVFGIDISNGNPFEGQVFYLNGKSDKMMGFTQQELYENPKLWTSLVHPNDLKTVAETTKTCIQKKSTVTRNYRLMNRKTGEYRWFEETITPNFENGKLVSLFGSARDVSERIESEKKIRQSEEKYRLLSENNRDLITLRDMEAKPVFISNSVTSLLGYSVEEYLKLNLFELIHPEDRISTKRNTFDPNFSTQARGINEGRIKHKAGHYLWLQTITQPVYDDKGNVVHIVGSSRDITKRKMLELELTESEKKYRSIFDNALVGIFRADLLTGKPLEVNDVCIKLFGFESKKDFAENFNAPERYFDAATREEWLNNLRANPSNGNQNIRFRRKDGSVFWGYTSAKLLPGNIIEGVVIDVTKSYEFEEKLKKNLTEKELLLKEIHHRVKNNLQIISSLLKLQMNKLDDVQLRAPLLECSERIHAIALIHEKLYLGEDVATINFSDYLANLAKSMLPLHSEKRIQLDFDASSFLTDIGVAIPLGLICYEIISNAFKHAFKEKKAHRLFIKVNVSENKTEIIIKDSGVGFNVSVLDKTKTLGWKLITNLAKQAKASVSVESHINEGSSFTIIL